MTDQAESMIREVMASDAYGKATATLAAEHDRTVEDIVTLTQIAAPSFQEETRARAFLGMAERMDSRTWRSMRKAMSLECALVPAMALWSA
jgi:hypothetical protein